MSNLVVPKKAWISLTGFCNNQCKWCYRNGNETAVFIDFLNIGKKIQTLAESGVTAITLIGGEPTLHPNFVEIVEEVLKRNLSCIIVTNGRKKILVPEHWKNNKFLYYVISLHGASPSHYFQNTNSQKGFEEMVENIRYLQSEKVNLTVNVVLGKETVEYLPLFYALVLDLKIKKLNFTYAVPSVDDENYEAIPVILPEVTKKIHADCMEKNIKHSFILNLPWCLLGRECLDSFIKENLISFSCPINYGKGFLIKENGALSLCTHLSNYELADTQKSSEILSSAKKFLAFWNSKKITEIRKTVNVHRNKHCVDCLYRFNCKGGCPLWWQRFDLGNLINHAMEVKKHEG